MLRDGRHGSDCRGADRDRGSAVVDFVLVGALVSLVFMAVIQLALVLHVRNTLIDAAATGARYGTLADRSPADGVERAVSLIGGALGEGYAADVTYAEQTVDGARLLEITVRAPLPVLGFIGPGGGIEVRGHAALP
ncbi:pilus assembly protein [Arthrobacter yangruifuii]|uniref:Pilus assembly protein n=1 Tax=Arthrobacter yangruifuii TaxID=2606616 RepID=A0A5N6MV31_9MICC|nr:TadE family protein [Arthrobacter yangruifuii]KAD4060540.1 pilus assembly protein [Arthrobacter yangruifuii]